MSRCEVPRYGQIEREGAIDIGLIVHWYLVDTKKWIIKRFTN
jgi:hypothetical protein